MCVVEYGSHRAILADGNAAEPGGGGARRLSGSMTRTHELKPFAPVSPNRSGGPIAASVMVADGMGRVNKLYACNFTNGLTEM